MRKHFGSKIKHGWVLLVSVLDWIGMELVRVFLGYCCVFQAVSIGFLNSCVRMTIDRIWYFSYSCKLVSFPLFRNYKVPTIAAGTIPYRNTINGIILSKSSP